MIEKQHLFLKLVARLILWVDEQPEYQLTGGELYRSPKEAQENAAKGIGISNSNHSKRLAIDLNLFINGQYVTASADYKRLGDYWKALHPLCRWGGDFAKPDGNHFSLEHEGIR